MNSHLTGAYAADIAINRRAQNALVKLLSKLQLTSKALTPSEYSQNDLCPIAHLAAQGLLNEEQAIEQVAKELHIPAVQLSKAEREGSLLLLDHTRLERISLERWSAIRALPIAWQDNCLTIATANPLDLESQEAIKFDLNCEIKTAICKESEIVALLNQKRSKSALFDLDAFLDKDGKFPAASLQQEQEALEGAVDESHPSHDDVEAPPVVRLVNRIFAEAVQSYASDIHLNPASDHLAIKIRVDGLMRPLRAIPNRYKSGVISRLKLLSGMDIAEKRRPQEGRLRIKTGFGIKDLRLSTLPTIHGENLVIRILCSDLTKINFEALGVLPEQRAVFSRILSGSSRVILVTGPTGSGKTTTLYAFVLHLRDGSTNIMTIEDPIEYRIHGVNQMQVNTKLQVDFATGLRSVMRQDPDVIMVGEIRDYETAYIAMQAAQTGHLVLSSMHTNSAAASIIRLRDLGLPSYVLCSSLGCVVAQRLVRKLCPHCALKAEKSDLQPYRHLKENLAGSLLPNGCEHCEHTGYRGRTAIYSVLEVNGDIRRAIREELCEEGLEQAARAGGFKSLLESGLDLVKAGATSLAELERVLGSLVQIQTEEPRRKHHIPDAPKAKPVTGHAGQGAPLAKRRVLLVEDDENTRTVLALVLEREMYEVVEAVNGAEALEKIYAGPPEIIVCDLMMPKMNGVELVKKVRHDARLRAIPILMLTAADNEANELQCLDCGADDFVSKASDSKVMLARVQRLLERKDMGL